MHRHRPVFAVFWRSDVRNPYIKKKCAGLYLYIYIRIYSFFRVSCITYFCFHLFRRSVWFLQNMCFHVKLIWTKQSQNNYEKDRLFSSWQFGNFFLLPLSLNFLMIWSHPLICISRDLLTQNSICWEDWSKKFNLQNSTGEIERLYGWARSQIFLFGDKDDIGMYWNPYHPWDWYICLQLVFFYGKWMLWEIFCTIHIVWCISICICTSTLVFRFSSWQVEGLLCLGAPAFFRCLKLFRNQKLFAKKHEIRFK